jgi:hypothetical protein
MPRFKINCSWREYHTGELIVKAKNEDKAAELLKSDQNRLLELLIDKYANETFESLSDIEVIPEAGEVKEKIDLVIDGGEIKVCES